MSYACWQIIFLRWLWRKTTTLDCNSRRRSQKDIIWPTSGFPNQKYTSQYQVSAYLSREWRYTETNRRPSESVLTTKFKSPPCLMKVRRFLSTHSPRSSRLYDESFLFSFFCVDWSIPTLWRVGQATPQWAVASRDDSQQVTRFSWIFQRSSRLCCRKDCEKWAEGGR